MTRELAVKLMGSKDVYLTEEGRQVLQYIINEVTGGDDIVSSDDQNG